LFNEGRRPRPDSGRLAELQERLKSSRLRYDAFRVRLFASHPELRVLRGESGALTAAAASQWVQASRSRPGKQGLAVLKYVIADERTWLFAIEPSGRLAARPIPITRDELRRRVAGLRSALRDREGGKLGSSARIGSALRRLDLLLTPASDALGGAGAVCIVPDGVLWEVPFSALRLPGGRHLVERAPVFCAPSVTALKAMCERPRKKAAALLLALAPFAGTSERGASSLARRMPLRGTYGALPASAAEVSSLGRLFGGKPLLGAAATESRARQDMARARFLHFATHGVFDPARGMHSGMVMAEEPRTAADDTGDSPQDGFLEAREIAEMRLVADLAVLSACETGRGELSRGEGIIGLSWAFSAAGCPSTVVSQWKVSDTSTSVFMDAFYRHLKAGKGRAEALRQAQLQLLGGRRHSHPYYWAPFILVGDWR
jgi:CHAT domain-containing protein